MAAGLTLPTIFQNVVLRVNTTGWARAMGDIEGRWGRLARGMMTSGRVMSLGVTLPILAIGGAAVRVGSQFEDAFANIRKTVDDVRPGVKATEADFRTLELQIRQIALQKPVSQQQLADIGAMGGKAGLTTEQLIPFIQTVADLSVAIDDITTEHAVDSLTQFAAATRLGNDKYSNLASTVVHLGNIFPGHEGTILKMSHLMGGLSSSANMSAQDIMGFAGALTSIGVPAERGGSAMNKLAQKINRAISEGGADLTKFAEVSGRTTKDFKEQWDQGGTAATSILLDFIKGLHGSTEASSEFTELLDDLGIKELRTVDVVTRLSQAHERVGYAVREANKAFNENNRHTEEARKKYETFSNQAHQAMNKLREFGIELFQVLRPTLIEKLKGLSSAFEKISQWLKDLSPEQRKWMMKIAGTAAALGPLLIGIASFIALMKRTGALLVNNYPGMSKFRKSLEETGTASAGLARKMDQGSSSIFRQFQAVRQFSKAIKNQRDILLGTKQTVAAVRPEYDKILAQQVRAREKIKNVGSAYKLAGKEALFGAQHFAFTSSAIGKISGQMKDTRWIRDPVAGLGKLEAGFVKTGAAIKTFANRFEASTMVGARAFTTFNRVGNVVGTTMASAAGSATTKFSGAMSSASQSIQNFGMMAKAQMGQVGNSIKSGLSSGARMAGFPIMLAGVTGAIGNLSGGLHGAQAKMDLAKNMATGLGGALMMMPHPMAQAGGAAIALGGQISTWLLDKMDQAAQKADDLRSKHLNLGQTLIDQIPNYQMLAMQGLAPSKQAWDALGSSLNTVIAANQQHIWSNDESISRLEALKLKTGEMVARQRELIDQWGASRAAAVNAVGGTDAMRDSLQNLRANGIDPAATGFVIAGQTIQQQLDQMNAKTGIYATMSTAQLEAERTKLVGLRAQLDEVEAATSAHMKTQVAATDQAMIDSFNTVHKNGKEKVDAINAEIERIRTDKKVDVIVDTQFRGDEFVRRWLVEHPEAVSKLQSGEWDAGEVRARSRLHSGGLIMHGGGDANLRPDEIQAILQRGEYVMRKEAVQKHGVPAMDALNAGKNPLEDVMKDVTAASGPSTKLGAPGASDTLTATPDLAPVEDSIISSLTGIKSKWDEGIAPITQDASTVWKNKVAPAWLTDFVTINSQLDTDLKITDTKWHENMDPLVDAANTAFDQTPGQWDAVMVNMRGIISGGWNQIENRFASAHSYVGGLMNRIGDGLRGTAAAIGLTWNLPHFHTGGEIPGTGEVPIMAKAGEYVIQKDAVKALGVRKLDELNKYHGGGLVKGAKDRGWKIGQTAPWPDDVEFDFELTSSQVRKLGVDSHDNPIIGPAGELLSALAHQKGDAAGDVIQGIMEAGMHYEKGQFGLPTLRGWESIVNYIDKKGLGGLLWGASRTAGSPQTTSGGHSAGSLHYSGKAVDMNPIMEFWNLFLPLAKAGKLAELLGPWGGWFGSNQVMSSTYPGHADHIHVGTYDSGGMSLNRQLATLDSNEIMLPLNNPRTIDALAGALSQAGGGGNVINIQNLSFSSDDIPDAVIDFFTSLDRQATRL